jgi:hypothetical protein
MNIKNIIKNIKKKSKAYIGAIGDDLPSLIPIFIGLTLFFSVFLTTYNVYKDNTDLHSLENEVLQIGLSMKQEPLVSSYERFMETCENINTNIKWNAFLVDTDLNADNFRGLTKQTLSDDNLSYEEGATLGDRNYFRCFELYDFKNLEDNRNAIIKFYPITLQKDMYSIPARLYIIGWK